MKAIRSFSFIFFLPLFFILLLSRCSGIRHSGPEYDDAYYSRTDRSADLAASAKAADELRKEQEAREKARQQGTAQSQPDYVNPAYKSSGQPGSTGVLAPSSGVSGGNTFVTNNFYRNNPGWGWGFSPYTSMGYNWMFPGYYGNRWGVSSFWGPLWASSLCDPWDVGFGFSPYYRMYYNPFSFNTYFGYNPWFYRPFFRYPYYSYSGSYWDNYQPGSGGGNNAGGRIKTQLPLGGTGTGVYSSGPSGGRNSGGRIGGREAVSGSGNAGNVPEPGTREEIRTSSGGFWRRTGLSNSGSPTYSGSSVQSGSQQQNTSNLPSRTETSSGFWRRNSGTQSHSTGTGSGTFQAPSFRNDNSGGRSQSGSSSGWGSGTSGGRSRSTNSGGTGPSGGRRR